MDMAEFCRKAGRSMSTVQQWLKKGIVPGAKKDGDNWIFSNYAMPPYTAGRPKKGNATSIRKTILKAALHQKSTCPKLFDITEELFDRYVNDLAERELVRVIIDPAYPGDKFIITTLKTDEYMKNQGFFGNNGLLPELTGKAIEGIVSRLMSK